MLILYKCGSVTIVDVVGDMKRSLTVYRVICRKEDKERKHRSFSPGVSPYSNTHIKGPKKDFKIIRKYTVNYIFSQNTQNFYIYLFCILFTIQ